MSWVNHNMHLTANGIGSDADTRRNARILVLGLWLIFSCLVLALSIEADILIGVLIVGLTSILETNSGARSFNRLTGMKG